MSFEIPDLLFAQRADLNREWALAMGVRAVARHRGRDRGREVYPEALELHYSVGETGEALLRSWCADPEFAEELGRRLRNRLAREGTRLPTLSFRVSRDQRAGVLAHEVTPVRPGSMLLGAPERDCSVKWMSRSFELPASQGVFALGRGQWRGDSPVAGRNDLALPDTVRFVSRRIARLVRDADGLLVQPEPGQRRFLRARRADGGRIDFDPQGRLPLAIGDLLVLYGGRPNLRMGLVLCR